MVRVEKILYEKVLNTSALGRARTLSTPAKWYRVNAYDHHQSNNYYHT